MFDVRACLPAGADQLVSFAGAADCDVGGGGGRLRMMTRPRNHGPSATDARVAETSSRRLSGGGGGSRKHPCAVQQVKDRGEGQMFGMKGRSTTYHGG